ncbi:MAG TPA: hypothetical protein HA257_09365 [Candidatus Methanoperedenaceae archaeon]|nr:hypothetical protein [Candidatus Methanoperedenaceae archaeon]
MPLSMETIVDARRFYLKDPTAAEKAAETLKKIGIPAVSEAVDLALQIGREAIEEERKVAGVYRSPGPEAADAVGGISQAATSGKNRR